MKLSAGLTVSHQLSLTPQLQQAIRILQLSTLELEQEIQLQLDANPLLERIEEQYIELAHQYTDPKEQTLDIKEDIVSVNQQFEVQELPQELSVDAEWDDIYIHQSMIAEDEWKQEEKQPIDIKQQLKQQINLLHLSAQDLLIAYCILDSINERGFLDSSLTELAETVQQWLSDVGIEDEIDHDQIIVVLKRIQRLDPIGVASRSFVEYLTVQLNDIKHPNQREQDALTVLHYPELLLQQQINKLLKHTKLTEERLKDAILCLKQLKKYPFSSFEYEEIQYQIPDIIVTYQGYHWSVALNPDIVPKLRINPFYRNLLRQKQYQSSHRYLRQHLSEAKGLIKNIDDRHKTILRVATCIVQYQQAFLTQGAIAMKPLVMREIAQELDLHESTISRAIMNKYMLTPKGLFELKYFFSSQISSGDGEGHSSTAIQARIQEFITQENAKKPLSDQALVNLLQQEGIHVARRTVTKYREALNIPSSSQRKILI